MRNDENRLLSRLRRRLSSARGSVYIEFAFVMTLVLPLILFSVDFMRILYSEQQLEIASRALCDIDSHMVKGDAKGAAQQRPTSTAKMPVRNYLAQVLAKNGFENDEDAASRVYCKGGEYVVPGPVQTIVSKFKDFLDGEVKTGMGGLDFFLKILGKIIGAAMQILTFNTHLYLLDVVPTDRIVKSTVSVMISPAFPTGAMVFFGHDHGMGWICLPQYANRLSGDSSFATYDRTMLTDQRVRYYCQMPYMDTNCLAPGTYVRKLLTTFKKWL